MTHFPDMSDRQDEIHRIATEKGWWDGYERDSRGRVVMTTDQLLAKLALIHSEVSEALEDVRVGKLETTGGVVWRRRGASHVLDTEHTTKPEGFPNELADVVIRCLDLAGALGINLDGEVRRKIEFNRTRPKRHGGKLA